MSKFILIVDDNAAIRTATRSFLENQFEFEVCGEAVDGVDAIEKVQNLHPDLIVLDLAMPRMNGLQAARQLREMHVLVPIILFAIYADDIQPQLILAAGVSAVVAKSDFSSLRQHINRLL